MRTGKGQGQGHEHGQGTGSGRLRRPREAAAEVGAASGREKGRLRGSPAPRPVPVPGPAEPEAVRAAAVALRAPLHPLLRRAETREREEDGAGREAPGSISRSALPPAEPGPGLVRDRLRSSSRSAGTCVLLQAPNTAAAAALARLPGADALGQVQQQKGLAHPGQPFSALESYGTRCCFRSQPPQILSPAPEPHEPSFAQGTAACPVKSTSAVWLPGCPAWENCSGVTNISESMGQGSSHACAVVATPVAMSPEVPGQGEGSLQGLAGAPIAHRFDGEFGSQMVQPATVTFPGRHSLGEQEPSLTARADSAFLSALPDATARAGPSECCLGGSAPSACPFPLWQVHSVHLECGPHAQR